MNTSADLQFPFVSICTPTRDRLHFISLLTHCIQQQTYPASRMEWVVVDDGRDSAEHICSRISSCRFLRLDSTAEPVPLGKKRNLCHQDARGDILIYMDDDDYYPPNRVAHAVERLQTHPGLLFAGSNLLPVYFPDRDEAWMLGPYGPNHATAATFAFKRELLSVTSYDEGARYAEERHFLKDYTIPMVKLESTQTILAFSHIGNTFDKRQLLKDPAQRKALRRAIWKLNKFIPDPDLREAYLAAASTQPG